MFILKYILSFAYAVQTIDGKVEFQKDLYLQQTGCHYPTQQPLYTLALVFKTSKKNINDKSNLTFEIQDENSKYRQTIHYKNEIYNYGSLFEKTNHQEFNTPLCEDDICEFEIFSYVKEEQPLNEKVKIKIKAFDENKKLILEVRFPEVDNLFPSLKSYKMPKPKLSITKDNITLEVSSADVDMLIRQGFTEIETDLQWRTTIEQQHYTEDMKEHELKKGQPILVKYKPFESVYLAALIVYEKGSKSFESKLELKSPEFPQKKCQ